MSPGRQQTGIRRFILVRDNLICDYCNPEPKPTDLVYIELVDGLEANYTARRISVGGKFSLKLNDAEEKYGGAFYHIETDYMR